MKTTFITIAAFAALTWAAPMSKRQCFVDKNGVQSCIDNPVCTVDSEGVKTCVSKREAVEKRQCGVDENGNAFCNETPTCHTEDDGTEVCVLKRSLDEIMERDPLPSNEKRQCYVDEEGKSHCNETPTCHVEPDGTKVCVLKSKRTTNEIEEREALPSNEKRQCYVDEEGESHCNDTPVCHVEPDGTKVCVL